MHKRDALRRAKTSLLSEGLMWHGPCLDAVPNPIERSWRRAVSQGLSPSSTVFAGVEATDPEDLLGAAARPVMVRLADELADLGVAVVLSDATGRIIERIVRDPAMRARMDRAGAVVGSDYSESAIGTNGLGTVIEDRRPLFVRGAEHFVEALEEMACSGVPIFDPASHRVRGSLSLACVVSHANALMLALTHAAVRDIEQRLTDGRDRGLHDLASAFAAATRRHHGAIAMLTPTAVLANTAGLPYVCPANHTAIWDRLVAERVENPQQLRVELTDGPVDLKAQRVRLADEELAYQVAISPVHTTRRPVPGMDRRWHPLASVDAELRALAGASPVVALVGEGGTGKSYVAHRILEAAAMPYDVHDPGAHREPWPRSWPGAARFALSSGRNVMLRGLESIPRSGLIPLGQVLDAGAESDRTRPMTRLVLTVNPSSAHPEIMDLIRRTTSVVELPRLASMRGSIPAIVTELIGRRAAPRRCTISAPAMQALARYDWPGNIGQLLTTVNDLAARHPGENVGVSDLPAAVGEQLTGRALSGIERSERTTIVAALREANGNRAEAARLLGIGRTTLYRKLRSLRIEHNSLSV